MEGGMELLTGQERRGEGETDGSIAAQEVIEELASERPLCAGHHTPLWKASPIPEC